MLTQLSTEETLRVTCFIDNDLLCDIVLRNLISHNNEKDTKKKIKVDDRSLFIMD